MAEGGELMEKINVMRASTLYARGELTVDDLVTKIGDGSIELPKATKPTQAETYEDMADNAKLPPFYGQYVSGRMSDADYKKVTAAVHAKYGA
jgi:hypothetical protein